MEDRINKSETRQCKAVFPSTLNANGTLFGGQAMQWMDEVAYITATRFTHQKMFTISTESTKFHKTVEPDSVIEIIGRVEDAGAVRLKVKVEIYSEKMYGESREKVIESVFVFAALDDNKRPKRIDYSFVKG